MNLPPLIDPLNLAATSGEERAGPRSAVRRGTLDEKDLHQPGDEKGAEEIEHEAVGGLEPEDSRRDPQEESRYGAELG